jgi:hypothetical protein
VRTLVAASCLLVASTASATSIDPLTWNQLLSKADFVGVVECTVAGEIVARYSVVESWKGAAAGSEVTISAATNFWGEQAPIALVGERYLVTAYKTSPTQYLSSSSAGPVPIWWRRVDAELRLPLFQGALRLPADATGQLKASYSDDAKGLFETDAQTLSEYRTKAQAFLALSPEAQESSVLLTLCRKFFTRYFAQEGPERTRVMAMAKELTKLSGPAAIIDRLLAWAAEDPKDTHPAFVVGQLLRQGGPLTVEHLKSLRPAPPAAARALERFQEKPEALEPSQPPPGKAELARLRSALKRGKDEPDALSLLTRFDCRTAADWVAEWKVTDPRFGGGHGLGSFVSWRCGTDRQANLLRITAAKDPLVRVAGAVYLAFEDEPAGRKKLAELSALPGDAGAWAAITLARRGDKASVPRALQIFETAADGTIAAEVREQLQGRLCVLLSNTKGAPPLGDHCEWKPELRAALEKWWASRGPELTLVDPWFARLAAQKVD